MTFKSQVLVVSDDEHGTDMLAESMRSRHFSVSACDTMIQAEEALETGHPHIIVVDDRSTEMLDKEEFHNLCERATEAHSKVVVLSKNAEYGQDAYDDLSVHFHMVTGPSHRQQLMTRLRTLTRIDMMAEEIKRRSITAESFGYDSDTSDIDVLPNLDNLEILVLGEPTKDFGIIEEALGGVNGRLTGAFSNDMALDYLATQRFDLVLINTDQDPDIFCPVIRHMHANSALYNVPILILAKEEETSTPGTLLEFGASDILYKPISGKFLRRQSKTLITEHRYHEKLYELYRKGIHHIISDSVTGLYSYGFFMDHLSNVIEEVGNEAQGLCVGVLEINDMPEINAKFNFAAGDCVLRQIGGLIGRLSRGEDLCARLHGPQFGIVFARAPKEEAKVAIDRIIGTVNSTEYLAPGIMEAITSSLSFGLVEFEPGDTAQTMLARAKSMYGAGKPTLN